MKRREFLKTSAAIAGLSAISSCSNDSGIRRQLGLQLYTLRDVIQQDPKGVIKKVAEYGYKELETFAYGNGQIYGMPFADFSEYVKDLGMRITSGHYGLEQVTSPSWDAAISDAKSIGQDYMVMPYLVDSDRKSLDDYKKVCEQLNKAGEACKKQGIRFGYHNHAFEFEIMDGQKPFDLMLAELDPDYVGIEMDIYWVIRAGEDPIKYFEKHPGRFEQWHVKDMDKNDRDRNADVGTGSIDYLAIFEHASKSGLKHWYVEQESYRGEPLNSVGASATYLKTRL
jgi:sugar phosphate isomerase/epimerase